MEKVCQQCGVAFNAHTFRTKFCGKPCYYASRTVPRIPKACAGCGKPMLLRPCDVEGNTFCSKTCKTRHSRVTKTCVGCGERFTIYRSVAHRYNRCSRDCTPLGEMKSCERCGSPVWQKFSDTACGRVRRHCSEECRRPPVYITCANCREQFRVQPAAITTRRFCCFACYRSFIGETRPEAAVRRLLTDRSIPFIQEHQIGRLSADFFLPEMSVIIEVDGTYWHNPETDAKRDRRLGARGYTVFHIEEAWIDAGTAGARLDEFLECENLTLRIEAS